MQFMNLIINKIKIYIYTYLYIYIHIYIYILKKDFFRLKINF